MKTFNERYPAFYTRFATASNGNSESHEGVMGRIGTETDCGDGAASGKVDNQWLPRQ